MKNKNKCIPCLGTEIKESLRLLNNPELDETLDKVSDCPDTMSVELCVKVPRKKSEYQVFIGNCMRSKPIKGKPFGEASKYMKECAVEWRKRKEGHNGHTI